MSDIRHARQPGQGGEFTVCGMAFDAFESGDADAPIVFAGTRQFITCQECCEIIQQFRSATWRLLPLRSARLMGDKHT